MISFNSTTKKRLSVGTLTIFFCIIFFWIATFYLKPIDENMKLHDTVQNMMRANLNFYMAKAQKQSQKNVLTVEHIGLDHALFLTTENVPVGYKIKEKLFLFKDPELGSTGCALLFQLLTWGLSIPIIQEEKEQPNFYGYVAYGLRNSSLGGCRFVWKGSEINKKMTDIYYSTVDGTLYEYQANK